MMSLSKEAKAMVTDHAIVRYMERVEGYDIQEIRDELGRRGSEASDINILSELYTKYGITRGHIAYKIVTKKIKLAIMAGAKRIKLDDWEWVIVDGVIVTIEPRQSIKTRKERRRRLSGRDKVPDKYRFKYGYHHGKKQRLTVRGN